MSRKQTGILVTLLLGVFMGALDIFIIAPALSAIQSGLHVTPRLVTWTITAYTLVLVVSQPLVAKLSDLYGRRWIYCACVTLFGAGSLLCALSHGFAPFIVGRSVQAVGAGGVLPVASAVVADVFPEERRGAALGIIGSVFGLAFLLGPIIGAVLTAGLRIGGVTTDWHGLFVVNLPLAALIILLAARTLPAGAPRLRAGLRFDWDGALLLGLALFCVIFGLSRVSFLSFGANFTGQAAVPLVLIGVATLVPFWLNEREVADPIVDTRAFSRRQLVIAMLLSIGAGIVTSSIVYVPQLVEGTFHLKTGDGGYYLVAVAITLFLGTPVVGRMIDRYGSRGVMLFGGVTTSVALALLLAAGRSGALTVLALLLAGLGLATFVGTPLRYIVVNEAAEQRRASSLAVLTVCNSVGQTIVLPLGGALIATVAVGKRVTLAQAAATVTAIHVFYAIVLAIVLAAVALTWGLKSRRQELADRRARQIAGARRHRVAPRQSATAPADRPRAAGAEVALTR